MVNGKSCTHQCQKMGYCTWVATKISYTYIILTVSLLQQLLYGLNIKALCKTFFTFLHGPQYVPLKQDSCIRQLVQFIFLTVIQRSWDETWNCDVQEMKSLWVPPRRHSNTQLPQQLVMTSDWWWLWRSLLWKNVLGHWISRWFATSCPLHAAFFASFCILSCALACWDSSAGTLMIRHMWWFPKKGESGHEAGCSCWCSYGFMSSLIPTHHSRHGMEGDSEAPRCKLVIKQVGFNIEGPLRYWEQFLQCISTPTQSHQLCLHLILKSSSRTSSLCHNQEVMPSRLGNIHTYESWFCFCSFKTITKINYTIHYHSKGNPCHEVPGCCANDKGDWILWVSGWRMAFGSGRDCMRICYLGLF